MAITTCTAQSPEMLPGELVRRAVRNESTLALTRSPFLFRVRKQTPSGSQTKLFVQTKEAVAGMIVAFNDQPLTPDQRQGEIWRMRRVLKDPEEMKKKQRQEKEDAERVLRIIKALPDAFDYEYSGTEEVKPSGSGPGHQLTRLRFRPKANYDPPTRVEQILTGMEGYLLIDAKRLRIARIDSTLARDVAFGWGILGHLDKGGHMLLDQGEVWQGLWQIVRLDLSFTGKLLFFKSISFQSAESSSDFRPVPPDLTYAQGVEMLKQQEVIVADTLRKNASIKLEK